MLQKIHIKTSAYIQVTFLCAWELLRPFIQWWQKVLKLKKIRGECKNPQVLLNLNIFPYIRQEGSGIHHQTKQEFKDIVLESQINHFANRIHPSKKEIHLLAYTKFKCLYFKFTFLQLKFTYICNTNIFELQKGKFGMRKDEFVLQKG